MEKFLKVKGTNLLRDVTNHAILNNSMSELEEYKNKRQFLLKQKEEINTLKNEISEIKSDISLIKELLLNMNK